MSGKRLPVSKRYKPSELDVVANPSWSVFDTPFDLAYWQAFGREKTKTAAAQFAQDFGVDARAGVYVEPVLRWKMSERTKRQSEPVVVCHEEIAKSPERAAVGSGVLFVVACEVLISNESWMTYRELCSTQPIAAAVSTLLPHEKLASSAPSSLPSEEERSQRDALTARFGALGASMQREFAQKYATTVDVAAHLSTPTTATRRENADNSDDMSMDALVAKAAGASAEPVAKRHRPTVALDDTRSALQKSVLKNDKARLNIILRGYVSRKVIAAAPRLQHNGQWFYVLTHSCIKTSVDAALQTDAPATGPDVLEERRVDTEDKASPTPLPKQKHLLDRVDKLADLRTKLTYYEVDRSARDRFSVHVALYAFWRTDADELPHRSMVCTYPKGYGAPVLQAGENAPGLLATAKPFDYAAIGLATLCIAAAVDAPFHKWLLEAEAYLYRLRVQDSDPREYLTQIEHQISAVVVPPPDSELASLVRNLLEDIRSRIEAVDRFATDNADASDESISDPTYSEEGESVINDDALNE